MSPEIQNLLADREVESYSSEESGAGNVPVSSSSTAYDAVDFTQNGEPSIYERNSVSMEDLSVVSEIHIELENHEMSQDDLLLKEVAATVAQRKNFFEHQLQEIDKGLKERSELNEDERCRKIDQKQERMKLAEMRTLVQ